MVTKKDRFEILLEHVVDKIDIVAEGHGILVAKIEEVDKKAETRAKELENMIKFNNKVLHEKIDNVETRLNEKIDNVETRLNEKIDNVETRLNEKIDNVRIELKSEFRQEINDVKKGITKIDEKLTHVLDRQDVQEAKTEKIYQKVFG